MRFLRLIYTLRRGAAKGFWRTIETYPCQEDSVCSLSVHPSLSLAASTALSKPGPLNMLCNPPPFDNRRMTKSSHPFNMATASKVRPSRRGVLTPTPKSSSIRIESAEVKSLVSTEASALSTSNGSREPSFCISRMAFNDLCLIATVIGCTWSSSMVLAWAPRSKRRLSVVTSS